MRSKMNGDDEDWGDASGDDDFVDRPTQLICFSDIYLLYVVVCQQKDIAGQSATDDDDGDGDGYDDGIHQVEWWMVMVVEWWW